MYITIFQTAVVFLSRPAWEWLVPGRPSGMPPHIIQIKETGCETGLTEEPKSNNVEANAGRCWTFLIPASNMRKRKF